VIVPFLEALDERVLVCDGAMGTMLYAQGVFINRSFDALNLSDPDRVRAVHHAYAQSGADVLETNTFGANRIKLRAFGLADRLREINEAGARLAREGARGSAFVAGAIGPLGLRIEPWGRMGRDEAHDYFREQGQALLDGGVDLFILETFRDLNEISAAIAAVRSLCDLPIVAQVTIEDDGNTLDGTAPEQFAPSLQQAGADIIGLNCSIGPAHMLETLERMTAATGAGLSAQPNAGRPRDVEGRTIYLTSPEYMASYARRFAERRVRLVGGCCGTTPDHIAQIKSALSKVGPQAAARPADQARLADGAPTVSPVATDVPLDRADKSVLSRAFANRRWVRLIELVPPRGHDTQSAIDQALRLRGRGIDAVHVRDGVSGPRLSALALAVLIRQQAGIEVVLQFSSRDKLLLTIQSELLGAHALGVRNLLAVTGEVHPMGDYPDATAVVDVDSIGFVNAVSRLNRGLDVGGQSIGDATQFHIGVTLNADAEDLDEEIRRFEWKVDAGLPVVLSVRPFESLLDAEYLANEVPGTNVPSRMLDRMRRASTADASAKEGVAICSEIARALRGSVHGVNVIAPPDRFDLGLALLDALA
jgi:methionine synthase / methylenetetrahydrofolate reductase(NADPH)